MAELYPLRVELDETKIKKLQKVFRRARVEIEQEIVGATNFGVANRKAILAQIDGILQELANTTGELTQQELLYYYEQGVEDANKQLKNINADIGTAYQFNKIHKQAVTALVDDTARAFAESITGVKRNSRVLLGKMVREEITQRLAKGMISGEALRDTRNAIRATIKEKGIVSLRDRGGHSWSLDRYSEMLIRTKSVEARNRGMVNRLAENNFDLVQVSDHMGECELCRPWEGRILSTTGATPGYPTLSFAEANGLFHPNCKHAINVLIPSLAKQTKAYYPEEKTRVISESEIKKATKIK